MYINLSLPPSSYQISELVKHLLASLTVAVWRVSVASCGQKVAAERPRGQCLDHLVPLGTKQLMRSCRSYPAFESLNTTVPMFVTSLPTSALLTNEVLMQGKRLWCKPLRQGETSASGRCFQVYRRQYCATAQSLSGHWGLGSWCGMLE